MKSTAEEPLDQYSAARLLTEGYSREENVFQTHILIKGNHFKAGVRGGGGGGGGGGGLRTRQHSRIISAWILK